MINSKIGKLPARFYIMLMRMIEAHDSYLYAHSTNTSKLSCWIAASLKWNKNKRKILYTAMLIHDLGKIGIPDAVLNKPSSLTKAELEMIRRHPSMGYAMLRPFVKDQIVLDVVYAHHENQDGTGYPRRLRGNKIPLAARIAHVVDSYDAATHLRPYHTAKTVREAVEELENSPHYDQKIVEVLVRCLHNHRML